MKMSSFAKNKKMLFLILYVLQVLNISEEFGVGLSLTKELLALKMCES